MQGSATCPWQPGLQLWQGSESASPCSTPPASLPGLPHLLVPALEVLDHLLLEDGLLALGALGQEQQAARLMEDQMGRDHLSFAARGRGKEVRLLVGMEPCFPPRAAG